MNRSWVSRARGVINIADYGAVCDGTTNDAAAVAAAIAALTDGSTLEFPANVTVAVGSAGWTGLLFSGLTRVTIRGNGALLKLRAAPTQTITGSVVCAIKLLSCTSVRVTELRLNGDSVVTSGIGAQTCTDLRIDHNEIYGCAGTAAIFTSAGTRTRITDNHVHDCSGAGSPRGIWAGNTNNDRETDLIVSRNMVHAISAGTGIVCHATTVSCTANLCHNIGTGSAAGIKVSGASTYNFSRALVANNQCRAINGHGIQVDSFDGATSTGIGALISGNVCYDNTICGLYVHDISGAAITNNICYNNDSDATGDGYGILLAQRMKYVTLSGNVCFDTRAGGSRTQMAGISVIEDSAASDNIAISGNVCRNNKYHGIQLQNTAGNTIYDWSVTGNVCCDNANTGILITEAAAGEIANGVVSGNVCRSNTTMGLRVSAADVVIGDNMYDDQQDVQYWDFTDADTTPSVAGRRGWRAANTGATSITAFDNGEDGQEITIRATNANTTLVQSGLGGLQLKGSTNTTIAQYGSITLIRHDGTWFEVSRSY